MPRAAALDQAAFMVWNLLANGMGGLDWSGLPLVCAWNGIDDIDGLLHRLAVIKTHHAPKDE